jgi:hypothetical protein
MRSSFIIPALSSKTLWYPHPLGLGKLCVHLQNNFLADCHVDVAIDGSGATVIISPAKKE